MIMCETENGNITDLKAIVDQMAETDLLAIEFQEDKNEE